MDRVDPGRSLVVYYSSAGTVRTVAQAIGRELGAELERLAEGLAPGPVDACSREYDLVVVGTSIVDGAVPAPVRAYLGRHRHDLRRIAFFCTYAGAGSACALREMASICDRKPIITLGLRHAEVEAHAIGAKVRIFGRELRPPERSLIQTLRDSSPSLAPASGARPLP